MYGITTIVFSYLTSLGYMPTILPVCVAPLVALSWFIIRKKASSFENSIHSLLVKKSKRTVYLLQFSHVIYLSISALILHLYPKLTFGRMGNLLILIAFCIICTSSLIISMVSQSIIKQKPLD